MSRFRAGDGLATPHCVPAEGGITESWTRDRGFSASVIYECLWSNRAALMRDLAGSIVNRAPHPGQWALYRVPHAYPPNPKIFALDIEAIEPTKALLKAGGTKWAPYECAHLKVTYGIIPFDTQATFDPANNRQIDPANPIYGCSQKVRASASFRTLPEGQLKFDTTGKTVESSAGKAEAQSEITLEFPHVPFNPYLFIRPYLGCANLQPIFGHGAGEVLLDSCDVDMKPTDVGIEFPTTLSFLARNEIDWNMLTDEQGDYDYVLFKSTGKLPFVYVNFWALFGFGSAYVPVGYPSDYYPYQSGDPSVTVRTVTFDESGYPTITDT